MKKEIIIYTDGACFHNPGPGGWGAVLMHGTRRKEISGGFRKTTNNRMEIYAAIMALKALNQKHSYKVKLHTDSKYLADTFNLGWIYGWQKKGWKRKGGPLLNIDLWQELLKEVQKHDVEFIWVKAHAGIPENERCDQISKAEAEKQDLPPDVEYEKIL